MVAIGVIKSTGPLLPPLKQLNTLTYSAVSIVLPFILNCNDKFSSSAELVLIFPNPLQAKKLNLLFWYICDFSSLDIL